jgi:hypothetical protein
VQSLPEFARANRKPGRIWLGDLASGAARSRGAPPGGLGLTFNSGLLAADTLALHPRGVAVDSLALALAGAARGRRGIRRVFTPASLRAAPAGDPEATLWRNQLPSGFGWLVAAVVEPGYVWSLPEWTHAQHGSTAPLDVAVPIAFLGPGIRPRRISRPVRTVDIAPTLAALLGDPDRIRSTAGCPESAGR